MQRLIVLAFGLAACGRFGFEDVEPGPSLDAGVANVDAVASDAASDRVFGGGRNVLRDGSTRDLEDAGPTGSGGHDGFDASSGAGGSAQSDGAVKDAPPNAGGNSGGSDIKPFLGAWAGTARNGSIVYSVETSVADRAVGQAVGLFFIPKFDCGGTTRLKSLGTSLVYSETLLYDPRDNCGPSGTSTLTPGAAHVLNYVFDDGRKIDRGSLSKLSVTGAAVPAAWQGVWMGQLTGSRPEDNRDLYLALTSGAIGSVAGHFLSPQIACSGRLVVQAASDASVELNLMPIEPPHGCTSGSATVRNVAGNLEFTWRGADGGSAGGSLRPFL